MHGLNDNTVLCTLGHMASSHWQSQVQGNTGSMHSKGAAGHNGLLIAELVPLPHSTHSLCCIINDCANAISPQQVYGWPQVVLLLPGTKLLHECVPHHTKGDAITKESARHAYDGVSIGDQGCDGAHLHAVATGDVPCCSGCLQNHAALLHA